jgi:threonine synthase
VAGLAGLRHAVDAGIVGRRESALAVITGSGLKDVRGALRAAGAPVDLPPVDAELDAWLEENPV